MNLGIFIFLCFLFGDDLYIPIVIVWICMIGGI